MTNSDFEVFKDSSDYRQRYSEQVAFRCSEDYKDLLEDLSAKYNLSVSYIVRMAVVRLVREEARASKGDVDE